MSELKNIIWTEKYRPPTFDSLILEHKEVILNYLKSMDTIPSFIFYSASPGTGKTSCAKVIANETGCDLLIINSSDERGIDVIRDKIKLFAISLSTNGLKRCIFLDEADGLTKPAQDSLRNVMETYSDNCFFILSCNDLSKIIKPIQSRCVLINFEFPPSIEIYDKLIEIAQQEQLEEINISDIISEFYPDIRSMISKLMHITMGDKLLADNSEEILELIIKNKYSELYKQVYGGVFNIMAFNKWLFKYFWENQEKYSIDQLKKVSILLADTEKNYNIGANLEVIFLSNILQVSDII